MTTPKLTYWTFSPPPTLAGHVRFFWELEGEIVPGEAYWHRSMADVCPELIFHYSGQFATLKADGTREASSLAGIQGPSKYTSQYSINRSFGIFGVYLYPYSLPMLFKIPAIELSNQYVPLLDLLGNEGRELEERMLAAPGNYQRVEIISRFLEAKFCHNYPSVTQRAIVSAVQYIRHTKGVIKVSDLARKACLSERQFERNFKQVTGFGPKLFSRIVRFHTVFNEHTIASARTLTEMALSCGYYDQSHFIEDFKLFSGHNPKHFFADKAQQIPWMSS